MTAFERYLHLADYAAARMKDYGWPREQFDALADNVSALPFEVQWAMVAAAHSPEEIEQMAEVSRWRSIFHAACGICDDLIRTTHDTPLQGG